MDFHKIICPACNGSEISYSIQGLISGSKYSCSSKGCNTSIQLSNNSKATVKETYNGFKKIRTQSKN